MKDEIDASADAVHRVAQEMALAAVNRGQVLTDQLLADLIPEHAHRDIPPMVTLLASTRLFRGATRLFKENFEDANNAEAFNRLLRGLMKEMAEDAGYTVFLVEKGGQTNG